ncbi:MAG: DNA gyrase subunit A [Alphaproteobacteria bacterium]
MSETPTPPPLDITPVSIEEEMQRSYLDYAMSVIVSRAIPDVRDGLKPVHRRILFAMKESGFDSTHPYRKSARIVGEVMGKYHPHGDSAIYDAMVRMAQDFSMRLELIDGQGNFGSMDGDPPAAMRYTEARLAKSAETMLEDIDRETVDFQPNYDESSREPTVLPAMFPNLLVNGANGIAVGMATNIPTHNLGEVIDACCAYIDNPGVTVEELLAIVPGPDFPTGGIIMGSHGIISAAHTGRGSVVIRSRTHIEELRKERQAIVITEIPFQVNKSRLVERISEVVQDKIIEGISDLRDESDRDGVRVVVELSRTAEPEVVLNQLFKFTPMQTSFGINMLALNGGRPELMNLKSMIAAFVDFREHVITRRTIFELGKARERAHILVGLALAVANLDEVIKIIRQSPDPAEARARLTGTDWPAEDVAPLIEIVAEPGRKVAKGTYRMSEEQAKAILDLRLHRLTGLEREKIGAELKDVVDKIRDYLEILSSRPRLISILRAEILEMKERFDSPRKTTIMEGAIDQDIEDLIQREEMVVTITHQGYVKRVPLSTYRAQKRGGRGRAGMKTKVEDFVAQVYVVDTHTPVLFFSSAGLVYKLKVYELPIGTPQSQGKALVNLLPLDAAETITVVLPLPEENAWPELNIMLATESGNVRRNSLADFVNVKQNGKIAMKLDGGDRLVGVSTCKEGEDVLLATHLGKSIRFQVTEVRVFSGRTSTGVRGIKLGKGDRVISMTILRHVDASAEEREIYVKTSNARRRGGAAPDEADAEESATSSSITLSEEKFAELAAKEEFILSVTERGYGKRTSAYDYRTTGRGGQGIANMEISGRNGNVVASFPAGDKDHLVLVTIGGQIIRVPVKDISVMGRRTQGVTLFRVEGDEKVVSVSRLRDAEAEDDETPAEQPAEPSPAK